MTDYHSTPFADNSDADTPWGALTAALATHGVLVKSDSSSSSRPDGEEAEARPCRSCADLLLLPPPTSSVSDADAETTNNDNINAAKSDNDNPPLLLVLISGSWCAPCRNFTPVLAASSSTLTDANCTVLFLSADADLPSFHKYYGAMPTNWRAVPYSEEEEDGLAEDDRDDLMEALGAASLPALVVLDPLSGGTGGNGNNANTTTTKGAAAVVVPNAVREVQAAGPEGMARLIGRWKAMAAANRQNSGTGAAAARPIQSGSGDVEQHEDNDDDDGDEEDD